MRKNILFLIVLLCLFSCKKQLEKLSENSSLKRAVEQIESNYKGVIIKKYSTRATPPTHIKVKTSNGKFIDISPNEKIVDFASVGDSIYKIKGANTAIIISSNGDSLITFYIKISPKNRNHKNFPKEWKNKWLESTNNDSTTRN